MILAFILVTLAAFFKAVADTLVHHFGASVFRQRNTKFWNPFHRWNDAVDKIFGYPLDALHIANAFVICAVSGLWFCSGPVWYYFVLAGWFFVVFNIFYDKILRDL
jgi:hypothetical protein